MQYKKKKRQRRIVAKRNMNITRVRGELYRHPDILRFPAQKCETNYIKVLYDHSGC